MTATDPQKSTRHAERVLFIGLEGVDWSLLSGVIQAGGLPNLAALLRTGISGLLAAPAPVVEATIWSSLLTGQRAHKHGVLHSREPRPFDLGTVPVSRPTLRTATLGAILSASELTVNQIGWPVSHPVENLRGVAVSNRFALEGRADSLAQSGGWPWITPPPAAKELFAKRCAPTDVEEVALAQLVPANLTLQPTLGRLQEISRAVIAESLTIFRATQWSMQRAEWDCTLCAFPTVSRLRQALNKTLSPEELQHMGSEVLTGCYEHLDMLLGQLIAAAGEQATIVLVGLGPKGSTPPRIVLRSPMVAAGVALPPAASVLDVTPTVLSLLGVPIARDMDGRVWTELFFEDEFHRTNFPEQVETWNTCIHQPELTSERPSDVKPPVDEATRHLVELGYVDPLETKAVREAEHCRRETRRNRALSLFDAGLHDEAIHELAQLKIDFPDWPAPYELLAEMHLQLGETGRAARELDYLIHHGAESAQLYLALGRIATSQRKLDEALLNFHVAERINSNLSGLQCARGLVLLRQRNFDAAEQALQQASTTDTHSVVALDGLAVCSLAAMNHERAVEYALAALEKNSTYAPAHYHLALALVGLGRAAEAKQAFELAATVDPNFVAPLRWLDRLCREFLDDSEQAKFYQRRGREIIRARRQARQANNA